MKNDKEPEVLEVNIAIISLGCPKNQVDADVFCRALIDAGHQTVPDIDDAEIVIINTCGFIESAKMEAIETIFDVCRLKEQRPSLKVVVTGCLAERYKEELSEEISELDAVVGIGKNAELPQIVAEIMGDNANETNIPSYTGHDMPRLCMGPKKDLPLGGKRVISTPRHYAWLKIAEGCSNACSYCAIPSIRGGFRSRPIDDCVREAEWLAEQGVKELVLVAQDVTAYGCDTGEQQLPQLLNRLNAIPGLRWIRLLYCYPEKITEELLNAVNDNDKVLAYFDFPIQHINERILNSMRRRGGQVAIKNAIDLIRRKIPDAVIRTSLIAGYPGETEEEFDELCQFVRETQFDRLGCFAYSPEEGTRAAELPGQLPQEIREQRAETIMRIQSRVVDVKQEKQIDRVVEIVCDGMNETGDMWLCRAGQDAPEIDANILIDGDESMEPGEFYEAKITGCDGYDLIASLDG